MPDDANRHAESERPLRAHQLEHHATASGRTRNIECGPTDGERTARPTRSGRGRRAKDDDPSGRHRRRES